jgi:non-specific serine/threonine protein kinase
MRYLARLVASPGHELHALDLVVGDGRGVVTNDPDPAAVGGGDAGTVLDPQAKAAYRRRLEQLRESGEPSGAVRQEIDFLEAELGAAVGLGGRDRRVASDAERARQSVTRAIKDAVDRLADVDAGLGRHLRDAVRTGIYSSYAPE